MASNLPPGVTNAMIEAQFADHPCEVCGQMPDNCICPTCPSCGEQGRDSCYVKCDINNGPTITCGGLAGKMTKTQKIGREKLRLAELQDQVVDQQQYIDWLESQPEEGE